jgi:chromosome segregation ATPase
MNNNEIKLDEKSGISIEEQKEILTRINKIAEKNRMSLSQKDSGQAKGRSVLNAKKKDSVFPLAVNIIAVVILIVGIFLLVTFNVRVDLQNRTGGAVYNLTEQALIEEIRRETAEELAAKDMEIDSIFSRLREVDAQLLLLQSSNLDLTYEQLVIQDNLLVMQKSYRDELEVLQDERVQILETSRSRETRLRAQFDERTREFAATQQRTSEELTAAMNELERITIERDRLATMESFFSGMLDVYLGQIQSSQTGHSVSGSQDNSDLIAENIRLENTIAEMQQTIDAFSSGSTGQQRRLGELEEMISSLRNTNTQLEQSAADKDRTISTLQTESSNLTSTNANLTSQVTELRNANTIQEQRIADLNNQLTAIRQLLQDN